MEKKISLSFCQVHSRIFLKLYLKEKNKLLISLNNKKDILISKNSEYVFI